MHGVIQIVQGFGVVDFGFEDVLPFDDLLLVDGDWLHVVVGKNG